MSSTLFCFMGDYATLDKGLKKFKLQCKAASLEFKKVSVLITHMKHYVPRSRMVKSVILNHFKNRTGWETLWFRHSIQPCMVARFTEATDGSSILWCDNSFTWTHTCSCCSYQWRDGWTGCMDPWAWQWRHPSPSTLHSSILSRQVPDVQHGDS